MFREITLKFGIKINPSTTKGKTTQSIELISKLESIQRHATKFILCLPFSTSIDWRTQLQSLKILPIAYWHKFLDIIFFYKAMLNFVSLNGSVLPVKRVARTMHYTNAVIKFVPKKCKTTTYQKSFFIRTCQIWNTSASIINIETQTLNSSKTIMFNFYLASLLLPYNPNNPETLKSICLKCNTVHPLNSKITCCI